MLGAVERAVVPRPEGADDVEGNEETDEIGNEAGKRDEEGVIGERAFDVRHMDFDDQQRDRDGKHGIGKEHQPLERMLGPMKLNSPLARHSIPPGCC